MHDSIDARELVGSEFRHEAVVQCQDNASNRRLSVKWRIHFDDTDMR